MRRLGTLTAAVGLVVLSAHPFAQGGGGEPGRLKTHVVTDGSTFWVYTIDTTTGMTWFLSGQNDGVWEWVDSGAAPNGPGPVGKYQLVAFANDKGAHIYVSDTTAGELWLVDEESLRWLPRGAPLQGSHPEDADRPGADEPQAAGRFHTQVVVDGAAVWIYSIDTTTGRTWFLDRRQNGVWEWTDDGAAPNGPGPVGRYQLVGFANDKGSHIYVNDTTTGQLWRVNEQEGEWLPRGAPAPLS